MTLSAPSGPATDPAAPARDKRGLGPLGWIVIGGLTAVFAAGWAVIYANVGQTPGISAEATAWNIRSASAVDVSYTVVKPKDERVRCVVDAFDANFEVLARREVIVPAGRERLAAEQTLTTPRKATGARIRDCRTV
ncbi:DUF4307 domain-containing protein [Actinomadura rayongensis]|uniref:DUF4307 domain-containing protein n=1 Tax=Actinomadura rayongensis TaxID=1429076 RepID=A0A6I4WCX6_9ACTN|nr:DUF4307 domain-containing protein [Actinomadura rayongensis]MXQ66095.1 DUF4307 domain-containing protein [Actinomadura rayongensis]